MSYDIITVENVSSFIKKFDQSLQHHDKTLESIRIEVSILEEDFQHKSNDIDDIFRQLSTNFSDINSNWYEVVSFFANEEILSDDCTIDLSRFLGVLGKIDDSLLEKKNGLWEFGKEMGVSEGAVSNDSLTPYSSVPNEHWQDSNYGREKSSFFFFNVKCGQLYYCSGCKEPIEVGAPLLRHKEESPKGSKLFRSLYYHDTRLCVLGRALDEAYIRGAKVVFEGDMGENVMERLQEIGFVAENIRTEEEPDCEDEATGCMASLALDEENAALRFTYIRKNSAITKKVICASCQAVIVCSSYLTLGKTGVRTLHIEKNCVMENGVSKVDFGRARCFVFKRLQNHKELTELISCGFHYNRIIGDKPQNPSKKGFNRVSAPPVFSSLEPDFFYRRRNNTTVKCVGCCKLILQSAYVTRGESNDLPLHIDKKCILSGDPVDFQRVQCRVFLLLQSHQELKSLLACGFYYNNIIGVRPRCQDAKAAPAKGFQKDLSPVRPTDVGFLFNEEAFTYERLKQGEKCQACSQFLKQGDVGLRHKERVPREKQVSTPLISQFYHATMSCLMKRGFTEKYLEFARCIVVPAESDNHQKLRDLLVRSGFSRDNLTFAPIKVDNPPVSIGPSGHGQAAAKACLFVVNCAKLSASCGGCGFNIALSQACFLYGASVDQSLGAPLFHISEACLMSAFKRTEIAAMTCINNNSLADVEAADIERCGVRNIVGLVRGVRRAPHRPIAEAETAAPQRESRPGGYQRSTPVESRYRRAEPGRDRGPPPYEERGGQEGFEKQDCVVL